MPKTYSMVRKINLGRYGLQYEAIDVGVDGCDTFIEAVNETKTMRATIHTAMMGVAKARLEELQAKLEHTFKEDSEMNELKALDNQSPF